MPFLRPDAATPADDVPPAEALHVERVVDPYTREVCVGMVRHAPWAYDEAVPEAVPESTSGVPEAAWHAFAARYLQALQRLLPGLVGDAGVHPAVWQVLTQPQAVGAGTTDFGWLPLTWHPARPGADDEPMGSFWVPRHAEQNPGGDGTLVLLAGRVFYGGTSAAGVPNKALVLASDVGLRLCVQVAGGRARVHGLTLAGLNGGRALQPLPRRCTEPGGVGKLLGEIKPAIRAALGRKAEPWLRVLEPVPGPRDRLPPDAQPPVRLRAWGHALRRRGASAQAPDAALPKNAPAPDGRAAIFDFSVDLALDSAVRVVEVRRNEFAGSAAADPAADRTDWPLFLTDGGSEARPGDDGQGLCWPRVTADEQPLLALRRPVSLALGEQGALCFETASASAQAQQQTSPLTSPMFEIRARRGPPAGEPAPSALPASLPTDDRAVVLSGQVDREAIDCVRTDAQAALHAQLRAAELFLRFEGYGIDPRHYFRFAKLPLVQRARGATPWAPEGDQPYAEARPFLLDSEVLDDGAEGKAALLARPQLLVKYGSADPWTRRRLTAPDASGELRMLAQYLGVAADPRWAWHEFGHVLNYASTGELELPFAHSAGDALAAIVADPLSALAQDNASPLRFATYPWIEVPGRSHGRRALEGYGWCCGRHLLRLDVQALQRRHHHGYYEEQMLSSALFRLYRCLGGDTRGGPEAVSDTQMRLEASDFTVHLILRAISLLGADDIAPARTPDQFVSALIDADLGLGDWSIDGVGWPLDPELPERSGSRRGGQAHKLIRWAFEQQGLYATDDPLRTAEGVGLPPAVDLCIASRRAGEIGGYAPVPLWWQPAQALLAGQPPAGAPQWLAADAAVQPAASGWQVAVHNRGTQLAQGGRLRAWRGMELQDGGIEWSTVPSLQEWTTGLAAGTSHLVQIADPAAPPSQPAGPGWLLLAVDHPADPCNLQGSSLPTTTAALLRLVAMDNNLALKPVRPAAR